MQLYEQGHETADPTRVVDNYCYILAYLATFLVKKHLDAQYISCYKTNRLYNFSMGLEMLMGFIMAANGKVEEAQFKMMRALKLAEMRHYSMFEYEETICQFYGKLVEQEQPARKHKSHLQFPKRTF